VLSIDGDSGAVYAGSVEVRREVVPEAAVLLTWAAELGIDLGGRRETEEEVGAVAEREPPDAPQGIGRDDVVRTLAIKGFVTPETLAPALGVSTGFAQAILDGLVADGLASVSGGICTLTAGGKERAAQLLSADREAWGPAAADAALDGFVALDGRMKTVVTAWQMREVDGRQVLNDHADAEHDARVLAELADLDADAQAWMGPHVASLPRLGAYARRLSAAVAAAAAGDGRYIASPRVDSYHGVWFELHEDLIRLAGRTREDEVAAGRA
jgi:pyruvate,orthophosphate dikinase